jgi:hypothetical protein
VDRLYSGNNTSTETNRGDREGDRSVRGENGWRVETNIVAKLFDMLSFIVAAKAVNEAVNYPWLKPVGFSLPWLNLLILLWISRGSASVRARSRPDARMFLAAFTSLSNTSPHFRQM